MYEGRRNSVQDLWRVMGLIHNKFVLLFVAIATLFTLHADVSCATWNLKWFPSGKYNVRNTPSAEALSIERAGIAIAYAINEIEGGALKDRVILFLQEIRDGEACSNLVAACNSSSLAVASVSDFKDSSGISLWQQTAILSTLPVVDSGYEEWRSSSGVKAPRGYAYAVLDADKDGQIMCFSIHLKSNLNFSGNEFGEQENILKRENSAIQMLNKIKMLKTKFPTASKVIVAGDFNTNEDDLAFVSEGTLRSFFAAHFSSCFTGMKKADRVTHPGNGQYDDATFDYILFRGFARKRAVKIFNGADISDHNVVTLNLSTER